MRLADVVGCVFSGPEFPDRRIVSHWLCLSVERAGHTSHIMPPAEGEAVKEAPAPVHTKPMSKSELRDRFSRLESRLLEYSKTPGVVAVPNAGAAKPRPATPGQLPAEYVSSRIQRPNGSGTNQFRSGIKPGVAKGGAAEVQWEAVDLSSGPEPASRVGMTLTPIGAGHLRRLALFGGAIAPTDENPYGGFAASEVDLFNPMRMRWCTAEERGSVKGRPPAPRVGHTAAPVGRHLALFFGGRSDGGLSSELFALGQHRCKAKSDDGPASFLLWSRPRLGSPAHPSARAHHACASLGGQMVLFGGEVLMRTNDRDDLTRVLEMRHKPSVVTTSRTAHRRHRAPLRHPRARLRP